MKNRGFRDSVKAAWAGVVTAWAQGGNIRFLWMAAYSALLLAFWFRFSAAEMSLVVLAVAVVLGGEMLNTAVEAATDLLAPDFHLLAKRAKDVAAGAVLVASLASVAVAGFLFLPRLSLLPSVIDERLAHPLVTLVQLVPLAFLFFGWVSSLRLRAAAVQHRDGGWER